MVGNEEIFYYLWKQRHEADGSSFLPLYSFVVFSCSLYFLFYCHTGRKVTYIMGSSRFNDAFVVVTIMAFICIKAMNHVLLTL